MTNNLGIWWYDRNPDFVVDLNFVARIRLHADLEAYGIYYTDQTVLWRASPLDLEEYAALRWAFMVHRTRIETEYNARQKQHLDQHQQYTPTDAGRHGTTN